jgi:hypothetical protein
MNLDLFTVIFASVSALVTSVISSYVTFKLNDNGKKRDLVFQEKKEAYTGILEAYTEIAKVSNIRHHHDIPPDEEGFQDYSLTNLIKAKYDFAYWVIRCKLVGSSEVNKYIKELEDTESNSEERYNALNNLEVVMQKDLKLIETQSGLWITRKYLMSLIGL